MIWEASFEPRIICLHIHQYIESSGSSRVTTSFGCTIYPATNQECGKSDDGITPDEIFSRQWSSVAREGRRKWKDRNIGIVANKVARGPVQLFVCRESRALALKRYERAFAGVARGGGFPERLSEKRIWVDFERDTIFVDNLDRGFLTRDHKSGRIDRAHPLTQMRFSVVEDMKRIKKLAIGGACRRLPGHELGKLGPILPHFLLESDYIWSAWLLWDLKSSRELFLDDSFGSPTPGKLQGRVLDEPREYAEEIRNEAIKVLAHSKNTSEGSDWEIPEVRVVRWHEWKDLRLGYVICHVGHTLESIRTEYVGRFLAG